MSGLGRENTPLSVAFLLGSTLLLGLVGFQVRGTLGALFGGLVATCISLGGTAVIRAVRRGDFKEERPMDLSGLDGRQSLAMLNQRVSSADGPSLRSEVLDGIAAFETMAEDDFPSARAHAESLMQAYPRAPAIPAALARLFLDRDQDRAASLTTRSIRLALDGGMNRVAADVFTRWPIDRREDLDLPKGAWSRLARALRARDHDEAASWAETQARRPDA
jgi:hypothetical protein